MTLVERLRQQHDCCMVRRCRENRCSAVVIGARGRIILSGSRYQRNHRYRGELCDCIIIWQRSGELKSAVVELKSGDPDASKVIGQLGGGADVLTTVLGTDDDVRSFVAVLVYSGGLNPFEARKLSRARIAFRGAKYPIVPRRQRAEL